MQARKPLLFHDSIPWVNRSGNEDVDVLIGWYDDAEVCELVGAIFLDNLSHVIDKTSVGLYRDNGIGVFKSHFGPETERKTKETTKILNTYNLPITIASNIQVVNFLDYNLWFNKWYL